MAELVLKVGSVSADPKHYQDGDILCAFNSRMIRCVHAQHICHVKNAGGGWRALRSNDHVSKDFFESTHQYRFERINRTQIKRITLSDMSEVIIDNTPRLIDGKLQHMDVEAYIRRRYNHERHKLFGTGEREIWYGGIIDFSNTALDAVWAAIESKTDFKEIDFSRWPAGNLDLKSHFFIPVNDFTDTDANLFVAPELDLTDPDNPITLRKRKRFTPWRSVVSAQQEAEIDDKGLTVDLRDVVAELNPAIAVQVKPDL